MKLKIGYSYFYQDKQVEIIHVANKKGWADVRDNWGRVFRVPIDGISDRPDPKFWVCKHFSMRKE